jgi:hypothetical protein
MVHAMSFVPEIDDGDARNWMEAYKAAWIEQEPDQIVRLFTPDAYYRERRFRPQLEGIGAIHRYWDLNIRALQRDIAFDYDLLATRGNKAFVHWRAHFTWLPIFGIMELDGIAQIAFAKEHGPSGLLATGWDEWIEIREA